jgi:DNA-binding transcriptional LysR family regulator
METHAARRSATGMLVFAEVVATGSFTVAARRLGLSKASVSREVARLERRLGAQLLRRTTRSMSLTEVGEVFYAGCQRVAEEAEQAERSVGALQAEPRARSTSRPPSPSGSSTSHRGCRSCARATRTCACSSISPIAWSTW